MDAKSLVADLHKVARPQSVPILQRFFKTGPGQYGEGDVFIGIKVPVIRGVCKLYKSLSLDQIELLLNDPIHEVRFAALVIMSEQAKSRQTSEAHKKALYELYIRRSDAINNWDLVDISCRFVIGYYLLDKPRDDLYKLAVSANLWQRRMAMVSTLTFLMAGQSADTYALAKILLQDPHDLIQKAVGWMLREAGKRVSRQELLNFLDEHARVMPRTALRYAIEHLSATERAHYLALRSVEA